jgi:hypothetical protein
MLLVLIILLNAVIALLGHSFDKVNANREQFMTKARADLIFEYLVNKSIKQRLEIEEN